MLESGGSSPPPSTTSFTPYTSAARNKPPMFSGPLGRCSASAANPSVIGASIPRFEPPPPSNPLAEPDSAFPLPSLFLFIGPSEGSGFLRPPGLAACRRLGLHLPERRRDNFRRWTSRRWTGEFAVRNVPSRSRVYVRARSHSGRLRDLRGRSRRREIQSQRLACPGETWARRAGSCELVTGQNPQNPGEAMTKQRSAAPARTRGAGKKARTRSDDSQ